MSSLVIAIIPTLLKLLGWLYGRSRISKERKENFLAFYKADEKLGNSSVKQHDDIQNQLDELDKL